MSPQMAHCTDTACSHLDLVLYLHTYFRVSEDSDYPPDATITASRFVTRNYTLSTSTAQIALIEADGPKVKVGYTG